MPDRPHRRGQARKRLIGYAILSGLALFAICDLINEAEVAASRSVLHAQDLAGARGSHASFAATSRARAPSGTPRVQLNRALSLARSAALMEASAVRDEHLALARSMAAQARSARPFWADADVVAAYVDSLQPLRGQAAQDRLAESYRAAPFLLDAAGWRIHYGLDNWAGLAPSTRNNIIEESFWLMVVDTATAADLNAAMRNSGAYRSFMLRLRTLASPAADRP